MKLYLEMKMFSQFINILEQFKKIDIMSAIADNRTIKISHCLLKLTGVMTINVLKILSSPNKYIVRDFVTVSTEVNFLGTMCTTILLIIAVIINWCVMLMSHINLICNPKKKLFVKLDLNFGVI